MLNPPKCFGTVLPIIVLSSELIIPSPLSGIPSLSVSTVNWSFNLGNPGLYVVISVLPEETTTPSFNV